MNYPIDITGVELHTERLLLRPFMQCDLNDLYEYASVPGVGEMAGWPHHKSIDETQRILDLFIANKNTFAVIYNGKTVGSIGIERYDEQFLPEISGLKARELGFVLSKACWGQGLMPEALRAVIAYCFDTVGLDVLVAGHYSFNTQSCRVQEKVGFKHFKQERHHYSTIWQKEDCGWFSLLFRDPSTPLPQIISSPLCELWDAYGKDCVRLEGVTLTRGEPVPEGMYHLVCEIIVRHTDGTYLLMQRHPDKVRGGLWELTAGGSVIQGETADQGALRELKEETGITAGSLEPLKTIVHDEHRSIYAEFLCVTDGDKSSVTLQEGETVAFKWVSREELLSMPDEMIAASRAFDIVRNSKP